MHHSCQPLATSMLPDGPEHAKGHATGLDEKVCKRGSFCR
jgi:hypothetical protein